MLVHGDTTTTFATNLTSALAALHFAPDQVARANLLREAIASNAVFVTGNTVVDALQAALQHLDGDLPLQQQFDAQFSYLDPTKRLILVGQARAGDARHHRAA